MIRFRTVRQGQRIALWDREGRVEFVDGPRRVFLWARTVQELPHYNAGADEYLIIDFRDGHREHVPGPAALWLDPVEHERVRVEKALRVEANDTIAIYSRENGHVERRLLRGPAVYVPAVNEWTARELAHYSAAAEEVMLDQTHDPTADFYNAVIADVIDFAAGLSFEEFKRQTERLNDLATYPQLTQRAARIGYRINKVVYRGYVAGDKLQLMHDDAIEARTQLKLEAETERQAQELADLKLQREAQRAIETRRMEQEQAEHEQRLKRLAHEEHLRQAEAEQRQRLEAERLSNQLELEHLRAKNTERAAFLQSMQSLQVDLTRYLTAKYQNPDRLIRIDGDGRARVHLHAK